MGFVTVTCSNCGGKGFITPEGGEVCTIFFKKKTCNECDGSGDLLVHAGQIRPYQMSVDLGEEESWTAVWTKHDDGVVELVDLFSEPTEQGSHRRFGR